MSSAMWRADADYDTMSADKGYGSMAESAGAAFYQEHSQAAAVGSPSDAAAASPLSPEQHQLASIVAQAVAECASLMQSSAAPARVLTKKQCVVSRTALVSFKWSKDKAPTTVTLTDASMKALFGDEFDFTKGQYMRSVSAGLRSTTAPYDVALRIRGIDSKSPDKAIESVVRPSDNRAYSLVIARGAPQHQERTLWANPTDPTMIDAHGNFDYKTELDNMQPVKLASGKHSDDVMISEMTGLGQLVAANEGDIAEKSQRKAFPRMPFVGDNGAIEHMMVVNRVHAKEVLDFYNNEYLGKLITTRFDKGQFKIDLVRPDVEGAELAKEVHAFDPKVHAGATAAAVNAASTIQSATVELTFHLVKNV